MSKPARFFEIYELVPRDRYEVMGEDAWALFDQKLIDTLDWIREKTELPITINDWKWNGNFELRGWRPKDCPVGAKKSAHKEGMAADFMVGNWTAAKFRLWLSSVEDELPHPIRCESQVTWCHIDTRNNTNEKLIFFKP